MKLGFTGTRNGMASLQRESFISIFRKLAPTEFHHGDCIGSDSEAHDIAVGLKVPVILHPPIKEECRAFSQGCKIIHTSKSYLARNRDIVNSVDQMIGISPTNEEIKRGGTWYTINYARKHNVPVLIIYPNGTREWQ